MSEMIERVIDAMQAAKAVRGATKEDVARAAIEAMREPTAAMIASCEVHGSPPPDYFWGHMIDAALA